MQQIDPNFDERNAGFNRFSKFVIEAGQKGVVLLNKLDNGQYEVAPGPHAKMAAPSAPAPTRSHGEAGREEAGGRSREDSGRRGRNRRGRGGRDRSAGRDSAAQRDRLNGSPRSEGGQHLPAREARIDGALTLARAFQLMSQALSEFRSPVGQEALRLRMVAMHGREDPLLDAGRFPRLLRQANDAEVADVRKVGDDDYEISAQRPGLFKPVQPPPAAPAEPAPPSPSADPGKEAGVAAGRDNGQRFGVRFRRGSRAPSRGGEVPLIGVVRFEAPLEPGETAPPELPAPETVEPPKKKPRARRTRKSAVAEATLTEPSEPGSEAPPPKRPRTRSRKKPE
jgi:ribonuclease E